MNRQDGAVIATAILWAGEIIAMVALLAGTEFLPVVTLLLAGGGAVNTAIVASARQKTA